MPTYLWKERGYFGSPELLYAAGATVAAWNLCELVMLGLLQRFISQDPAIVGKVHALLGNASRADLLRYTSQHAAPAVLERVQAFLAHYSICLENRNLIAHAMYSREFNPNDDSTKQTLKKHVKGSTDKLNTFDVDEDSMMKIADECYTTYIFGMQIIQYVLINQDTVYGGVAAETELAPLPQIPPSPVKLNPRPQSSL